MYTIGTMADWLEMLLAIRIIRIPIAGIKADTSLLVPSLIALTSPLKTCIPAITD